MRSNPTDAEATLWRLLRDKRLVGYKFRRQLPVGRYVADFACLEAKVIVELDGSQHAGNAHDLERDGWLAAQGFHVLRVWNNELTNNRNGVLESIWSAVTTDNSGEESK